MSRDVNSVRGRAVLTAAFLALLALVAFGAWILLGGARGNPADACSIPVSRASDKSLGINVDLAQYDAPAREQILEALAGRGFVWIRQRFPWDRIEPRQGSYDWSVWDEIIAQVSEHDIKLIGVLDGSPEWARANQDRDNPLAPPEQARHYGAFASAFSERYGDRIDHYQIWDEPNIAPHWGAREVVPSAYVHLLREGAIQIRNADPNAVILGAALAPNVEPGGTNMSDLLYLDALYQEGAAEWFDIVAAQVYGFQQPLDTVADPAQLNWQRPALLQQVMEAHGDAGTPMWAVSFGLEGEYASEVTEAVHVARRDWPWLGPMLWAAWSPSDVHGDYALLDDAGRPTGAAGELSALAEAQALAWPGVYPAEHPSGHYEGDWRVAIDGADIGQSGDRLVIPFHGTRLDLAVRRGEYRAFLYVTVDGEPASALPQDEQGRSYVVLYDPLHETDSVTVAEGLPDGDHVAEIVAERGWGQWAILGWTVCRETGRPASWLAIFVALGLVALGLAAYRIWPERRVLLSRGRSLGTRYAALDHRLAVLFLAGSALLVYIVPGTIASLAAMSLLFLLLLLRPEPGLMVIALSLPFYQIGKPLVGKVFSMTEILTLMTAAGWLGNRVLVGYVHPLQPLEPGGPAYGRRSLAGLRLDALSLLDWGVVALLAVAAVSLLWTQNLRVAAREFRTVVLESVIYYGLLRAMVRTSRRAWRVADAWVLGGLLLALLGLAQLALGQGLITADGVSRVRGFYGSPNNLALYLGRVLPLTVAVAAWGRGSGRRLAYGAATIAIGLAILLSYSRGAWLLGVPASLLFIAAMRGRRALAVSFVVLLVVAGSVLLVVGPGRLLSLANAQDGTAFFRLQLWRSSWAMLRDHPLLGVGLDNFLYYYRTQYVLPTAWEEFNLSHPHNLILDSWLRIGLPGLLVHAWLVVVFFWQGWRAYRRPAERIGGEIAWMQERDRLLALGLMGGMVNFVVHGLVDNAFFLVDLAFVFMLMLALIQVAADHMLSANTQRR